MLSENMSRKVHSPYEEVGKDEEGEEHTRQQSCSKQRPEKGMPQEVVNALSICLAASESNVMRFDLPSMEITMRPDPNE